MVSIFSAAKRLCEKSGWSLTHLEIQKMAYLAHMFYMGEHDGAPLVSGTFEAWDFGPVHPALYHALKKYGAEIVGSEAFRAHPNVPDTHDGARLLDGAVDELPRERLVAITHWREGAWQKNYKPLVRGIKIPNSDIMEEYRKRQNAAAATRQ